MAICGIYKITSPSGKIYIGQSLDIEKRWRSYKNVFCYGQPHLYNSLKKYGSENHLFEILCECSEEELNEKESYYVSKFDSFNPECGLNLRSGGGRGEKLSEASRKKSGLAQKINWQKRRDNGTDRQSQETIQKRVASVKATIQTQKEQGIIRKHSEESKEVRRRKCKEYQLKIKQDPNYYSEEQIIKRKQAAKKGLITKIQNGTTGKNKKRTPKYGVDNPFFGKKHSKETIDKIQQSRNQTWKKKIAEGWKQSDEHVSKRVQKQLGKKRTPEQIQNIKSAIEAKKQDKEYLQKVKEKMSESQKLAWERKKNDKFYSEEEKAKRTFIANKIWAKRRENKKAA